MADPLVEGLRRGDERALTAACAQYGPRIYAFLRRLAQRPHVADDLYQETWLALARKGRDLREDTDLQAWLFTVARNAFRTHRRWEMLDVSRWVLRDEDLLGGPMPDPERQTDAARAVARLEGALHRLKPASREVLLLVAVEGLDQERAAQVLGLRNDALRQRLKRAREELEGELQRGTK